MMRSNWTFCTGMVLVKDSFTKFYYTSWMRFGRLELFNHSLLYLYVFFVFEKLYLYVVDL